VEPSVIGPTPLLATFQAPDALFVQFSEPLVAGPLATANWTVRVAGMAYSCMNANTGPSAVNLFLNPAGPDVGPDVVSYAAAPADVISLATGFPAAAFTDFPVV